MYYVSSDTGSDTSAGDGRATKPFRTIFKALQACASGDTIQLFACTSVFGETVDLNKDTVALVGMGASLSIIDPGDSATSGVNGIYADTQSGLVIRNLGVRNAYHGVVLQGTAYSLVENVVVTHAGNRSVFLLLNADSNIIRQVTGNQKLQVGIAHQNRIETCTMDGFHLSGNASFNTLTGNTAPAGNTTGFYLQGVANNTLTSNTCTGSTTYGFMLFTATNNTLTGNAAAGGANIGFYLQLNSDGNLLAGNTASGNNNDGFKLSQSNSNTCSGNTSVSNRGAGTGCGFYLSSTSTNNRLQANYAAGNPAHGFYLGSACDNNTLLGNRSYNNSLGFGLLATQNNLLTQNTADSNAGWAVTVETSNTGNIITRNNILPSVGYPDSGVLNTTASALSLARNWFGTTDSSAVAAKTKNTGGGSIVWMPFRLGTCDTTVGADTIAPQAPATVTAVFVGDTGYTITWSASSTNEEIGGAVADIAGYRVYRSATADTSYWQWVGNAAGTTFTDSNISGNYRYRVTAYDNHSPWPNESYYSDSIASPDTSGPGANVWYVNDTATAGDGYCTNTGDNANHGLTPGKPKRTIAAAKALASAGDTIYIDAGCYQESVVNNSITGLFVIGRDSAATIIDPAGDSGGGGYGVRIWLVPQVTVRDLAIRSAQYPLEIVQADSGCYQRISLSDCDKNGYGAIHVQQASGNRISDCAVDLANTGAYLTATQQTVFERCVFSRCTNYGAYLTTAPTTAIYNSSISGTAYGLYVSGSTDCQFDTLQVAVAGNNEAVYITGSAGTRLTSSNISRGTQGAYCNCTCTFISNVIERNTSHGLNIAGAAGVYAEGNLIRHNAGSGINATGSWHRFVGNTLSNNSGTGINAGSTSNYLVQNYADSNGSTGFSGILSGDTFVKNNWRQSPHNAAKAVTFSSANVLAYRNYFASTDSAVISGNITGAAPWQPYRLSFIDT
ncbi:MAG TPA: NosD domain-containing protein, partial [bacterium]|nr:NosD domain-containing protein [bacterium]